MASVKTFLQEQDELSSLLRFLDHPSSSVRCWAATFLLPVHEQEAILALENLTKMPGITALDAEYT